MNAEIVILLNLFVNLVRYFLFAGLAYLLFYSINKSKWAHRKIQAKYPEHAQISDEIKNSLNTIFIFAYVGITIFYFNTHGLTKMYWSVAQYGWVYFFVSIGILIVWHDTYFYWSHRALHHPKLFRFHLTHHHSHNTTPFTAFSFHPVEAIVQTGFLVIVFFIPVHVFALAFMLLWQMLFNVLGHLGFEVFPKKAHQSFVGKQFNTVTHHNMHHRYTNQNYGLYFSLWDRVMKTNHKDYEQQYLINADKMYNHLNK